MKNALATNRQTKQYHNTAHLFNINHAIINQGVLKMRRQQEIYVADIAAGAAKSMLAKINIFHTLTLMECCSNIYCVIFCLTFNRLVFRKKKCVKQ